MEEVTGAVEPVQLSEQDALLIAMDYLKEGGEGLFAAYIETHRRVSDLPSRPQRQQAQEYVLRVVGVVVLEKTFPTWSALKAAAAHEALLDNLAEQLQMHGRKRRLDDTGPAQGPEDGTESEMDITGDDDANEVSTYCLMVSLISLEVSHVSYTWSILNSVTLALAPGPGRRWRWRARRPAEAHQGMPFRVLNNAQKRWLRKVFMALDHCH